VRPRFHLPVLFNFTTPPPLGVYIHLPWCVRKCPYCDFNSHEARAAVPETKYVDAVLADLEKELPAVWGRTVQSIFIGGGTPNLFSPEAIDRLLCGVRARLSCAPALEITMEANPGAYSGPHAEAHTDVGARVKYAVTDSVRFAEFRSAGVTRLSLGAQSFDAAMLSALGRIHGPDEIHSAARAIATAGFENWNIDLMYGLPGQTAAGAIDDLETALRLEPSHVSHYQLTIEPNTSFHHRPPPLPDEDTAWEMQRACQERLAANGFAQYEVSAYARDRRWCAHNVNYWTFGDYVGVGAGAHGKITTVANGSITRRAKLRHPRDYVREVVGDGRIATSQVLRPADAAFEFMLNALRLIDGFPVLLFQERTGLAISVLEPGLTEAERRGLIERDHLHIRPTERGLRFLNDLMELFLPATAATA
jgi:putative oxygen-independent coproporphyrinogen III oxidase